MIDIDHIHEGMDLTVSVSRARLAALSRELFCDLLEPVERVLANCDIRKAKIHSVVLVGASTRMPRVQQLLSAFFDGKALLKSIDPTEVIAHGAAIRTAILQNVY
ncbi:hypothetical protein RQP46_008445 [Phenoliferia psychrophenolica]